MGDMKDKPEEYWRKKLTPEQFHILREKGTEYPGSGTHLHENRNGEFRCAACGQVIFASKDKYDSTVPGLIGWPSFSAAAQNDAVELKPDNSFGMHRFEVVCSNCGSHLGHLFDDESSESGKHYCINSTCLLFDPKKESKPEV